MMPSLQVTFRYVREVRMGSPHNTCDIEFDGAWGPPLPTEDYQDIKAESPDGSHVALIQWNTRGNTPGFHVIRIDTKRQTWHKTRRIAGICKDLRWAGGRFVWRR